MKTKAVNMCMGCGRTVDTSAECYFDSDYGLYSHVDCESKIRTLLKQKTWIFENRRKEWKKRNEAVFNSKRLEY